MDVTNKNPEIFNLAQCLLAAKPGEIQDPSQLASAAERACERLKAQVEPLIGPAGFSAALSRALRQTQAEFSFLVAVGLSSTGCVSLTGLTESLQGVDYGQAEEGLTTVFANFIAVLISFWGWDLSARVVRTACSELNVEED